ncbi:MAG: IPTL-CTERM sorting domain-containing protein [Planctomycetota bacterium]
MSSERQVGAESSRRTLRSVWHPLRVVAMVAVAWGAGRSHAQECQSYYLTASIGTDFRQPANQDPVLGDINWINSILQQSNSVYLEGMSTPQRGIFNNIESTTGNQHTLTLSHQANKGSSTHAYDYLTSWAQAQTAANLLEPPPPGLLADLFVDECGPAIGPPATTASCTALSTSSNCVTANLPDNMGLLLGDNVGASVTAYETSLGNRTFRLCAPSSASALTGVSMTFDGYSSGTDKDAQYTVRWTSNATEILFEVAGHIAVGADGASGAGIGYGTGRGASAISGGPYHFKLSKLDGDSLGSQDNQLKGADVRVPFCPSDACSSGGKCDDGNPCTGCVCNETSDSCSNPPLPSTTSCEADGNLCTIDFCNGSGTCVTTSNVSCQAANPPCEGGELCNPGTGQCVAQPDAPLSTTCEADGNLCTTDHCNGAGACVTYNTITCSGPTGPCDAGTTCNPNTGGCDPLPDPPLSTPCEADGNLCTTDHCNGTGACATYDSVNCPGPTEFCDGGTSCNPNTGACDPLADQPLSTPCERDGNACTIDHCNGQGACALLSEVSCAGPTGTCDGGTSCNPATGVCDPLPDPPLSTPCEADGDLCTTDHCSGTGACVTFGSVSCPGPTEFCDGGTSCNPNTGACDPLADRPLSTPCDRDGNACTVDHCNGQGTCTLLNEVSCPGAVGDCEAGQRCDPADGLCKNLPDAPLSTPCEEDGSLCTLEHCNGTGTCVFLNNVTCPGSTGTCDAGTSCNPATGGCDPLSDPLLSTPCEGDGNLCTIEHCNGTGSCVFLGNVTCAGSTGTCDAGTSCNSATGACDPLPDPPLSTPCEQDGNYCTIEHCSGTGSCVFLSNVMCSGSTGTCDAGTSCNPATGGCDPLPDPPLSTPCEADGNLCTIEHCNGQGSCVALGTVSCPGSTGPCDGGTICNSTTGACDPLPDAPAGTLCDLDNNLCTKDICTGYGDCVYKSNKFCPGPTEFCDAGTACNPTTGACDDLTDPPLSTPCDRDANACTRDHCNGQGQCVLLSEVTCPGAVGDCDAGQRCDQADGLCKDLPDAPLSTPCEEDGNLCTIEHCNGTGACVFLNNVTCPGSTGTCDAGTSCNPTTGGCDPLADPPLSTPCEADGNLCTNDHCDGQGSCLFLGNVSCPGSTGPCDNGTACNTATGVCDPLPDPPLSTPCEADGNLCTNDHCDGTGSCVFLGNVSCPGSTGTCDGGTVCNVATGNCDALPEPPLSTPCEADGNRCTNDHCNGFGSCVFLGMVTCPGSTEFCDAGTACNPTTGACDDLTDPPLSTPCDRDANACTRDHCNGQGTCVLLSEVTCPGAVGDCEAGQRCDQADGLCKDLPDAPLSTPCEEDGNLCTIEHCSGAGSCVFFYNVSCPGPTGTCDSGTACNSATGGCDPLTDPPLSTPCEADGNLCTNDHCDGQGSCVFLGSVSCPGPTEFCDSGTACNSATGACDPVPDRDLSTPCEADGNRCTIDHCNGFGSCVTFDNVVCPGSTGVCDAGTICNTATGACDDISDPPYSTVCESDGDLCTKEHCDGNGACVFMADVVCPGPTGPCDSGQACNSQTGACGDLSDPPLSTPCQADGTLCTIDHCDGLGACVTFDNVVCPGATGFCDAGTACNPSTGGCDALPDPQLSTPCEADGNLCTLDHCNGTGQCVHFDDVTCPGAVPPCEAGQTCDAQTGTCVDLPDPPGTTPCELDGNLCTVDHCDAAGHCVFDCEITCPVAVPPCEGGQVCDPNQGLCSDLPDAPLSTPCQADTDVCTEEHCNGLGLCVLEVELCGACCDGETGICTSGLFPEECVGVQASWFQGHTCEELGTGPDRCERHTGACCNASPGLGGACTDGTFPEECVGAQMTWHKDQTCAQIVCDEHRGACCDRLSGTCNDNLLQSQCTGDQPVWTKGATCAEVACAPSDGACCNSATGGDASQATCTITSFADCQCIKCVWTKGVGCGDVICNPNFIPIPTVSEWGLVVLTLLLLTGAKVRFGRRLQPIGG